MFKKYYSFSSENYEKGVKIEVPPDHNRIQLENLQIPKSYYLIPAEATLTIGIDITIQEGNYNVKSFKLRLLEELGATWDIYFPNSKIERDDGKYIIIPPDAEDYKLYTSDKYVAQVLGIKPDITYTIAGDFRCPYVVNFNPLDCIHLRCSGVIWNNNLLYEVYTTQAEYNASIIAYNQYDGNDRELVPRSSYKFFLTDQLGAPVDLHGNVWTATISTFHR